MVRKFIVMTLLLLICAKNSVHGEIYDCFLFFNELEILDIRFHELYDKVDKFVIVESVETFRGNLKPLYFDENRLRYKRFLDKIIHVVVYDRINTTNPWIREEFQRNQIMRGLIHCQPDDLVFISDADEIIRATALVDIVQSICGDRHPVVVCEQPMYRYYLNVFDKTLWGGTCATTFAYLIHTSPESLRLNRYSNGWQYKLIPNAGWHFTSIGGLDRHIQKIESFSHSEYDIPKNKKADYIRNFVQDLGELVPIDETFPKFIQENQELLKEKGFFFEEPAEANRGFASDFKS